MCQKANAFNSFLGLSDVAAAVSLLPLDAAVVAVAVALVGLARSVGHVHGSLDSSLARLRMYAVVMEKATNAGSSLD